MNTVVAFPTDSVLIKKARKDTKLTLTQAVLALEDQLSVKISPKTLEKWEGNACPSIDAESARSAYEAYRKNAEDVSKSGKYLLFGAIPISTARDILQMSSDEIGETFGYSASFWAKIEANSRFLPEDKLRKLEVMIQDRFLELCSANRS